MPRALAPSLLAAALAAALPAAADGDGPIQDNSFLVEEAYNQEPGVIQHIGLFTRDRASGDWALAFTEEWPAGGQTHQVSVTLQAASVGGAGGRERGLGDTALNYRWQAVGDGDAPVAVAPRLSVLLPTGDRDRGLGTGAAGAQVNLPVSATLGRWFVGHFNVGATWAPSVRTAAGRGDLTAVNLSQGLVWLLHRRVNPMLEVAYGTTEIAAPGGALREDVLQVSPGIRAAIDLPGDLQVVGGVAVPLGVGPSAGERAVLAYLSFEHPFRLAGPQEAPERAR